MKLFVNLFVMLFNILHVWLIYYDFQKLFVIHL